MKLINEMLNEGYILKEISIDGKIFHGEDIKNVDFISSVYIEFFNNGMLIVPYNKIDYVYIVEEEE